jgi:hypothetical protein
MDTVRQTFENIGIPFGLYDVSNLPDKDSASQHDIFWVHDQVKSKAAIVSKVEKIYGKEFIQDKYKPEFVIPTPKVYMSSTNLKNELIEKLQEYKAKHFISSEIDMKFFPPTLEKALGNLFKKKTKRQVIKLRLKPANIVLEIRPEELNPTEDFSLTYEEFIVLIYARQLFEFDKAHFYEIK